MSCAPIQQEDQDTGKYSHENLTLEVLVRSGKSWSGHEANCCFLNTGQGRFSDISSTSGFDFLDDGRAIATSDWDFDGDLDIWLTNRTGPTVRFLRNQMPKTNHFVSFQLNGDGSHTNRDAIGARVEVVCAGDGDYKRIKTLRAGSGYLSQSTKLLSFGLGEAQQIEQVHVSWPGGETELFQGVAVDAFFILRQGTGQGERWTPPQSKRLVKQLEKVDNQSHDSSRTFLAVPHPVPTIAYRDLTGKLKTDIAATRPVLLTLWATWCGACVKELREIAQQEERLRAAGIEVIALNVDSVSQHKGATDQQVKDLLKKIDFPFTSGFADQAVLERLDHVYTGIFDTSEQLTLPGSFLIGPGPMGIACAFYRGQVDLEQLLADVRNVSADPQIRREVAVPFPGKWFSDPTTGDLTEFAAGFRNKGFLSDTETLYRLILSMNPNHAQTHQLLGEVLTELGRDDEGNHHLQQAKEITLQRGG